MSAATSSSGVRDLLSPERVRLGVDAGDWRAAISAVGQLMVDTGTAEPRYIEAMIASCEKFGPYIVIAPGLALPHAAPTDGALRDSLALITLTSPVEFGNDDNDPVHVVLALSAVDHGAHLEQLRTVSSALQALSDQGDLWLPIREATTPQHVIDILTYNDVEDR